MSSKSYSPDRSLFEDIELPEGIDLDTLKGTIFLRCNEFEVLYSDPEFMIAAIAVWGKKNYWTFDRWVKLLDKEYDPLYNKDYHEVWTDTHAGNYQRAATGQNLGNSTDSGSNDHSERASNEATLVNTMHDAGSNSNQYANSSTNNDSGNDSHTDNHSYHGYGNIGITSAQELFLRETDVAKFNMYEHIADLFCSEFCIMVY